METTLRIAIQKKGRLYEKSVALLRDCGIPIISSGSGKLLAKARNFPLEVLFLRDDDIPKYVEENVAVIGIAGENVGLEIVNPDLILEKLGFSRCRLSLAVRREAEYPGPEFFEGKKIATSYPRILRDFLQEKGIAADIEEISGSVEIAPAIGLAEGVCDIVSTGSTLLSNGLREVETVLTSEAVLIAAPNLDPEKQALLEQLLFRIDAARKARNNKYILLNIPNDKIQAVADILPGMKSPTVLPLAREGWSSLHSVVPDNDFWLKIADLKDIGAEGILVIPIEKMVQ